MEREMRQVNLIRGRILRQIDGLRIYISTLPVRESYALSRLHGIEGVRTAALICDCILRELGHTPPSMEGEQLYTSPTIRRARRFIADSTVD